MRSRPAPASAMRRASAPVAGSVDEADAVAGAAAVVVVAGTVPELPVGVWLSFGIVDVVFEPLLGVVLDPLLEPVWVPSGSVY